MADYRERDDSWRDAVAPAVQGVQRVGINPETNSITPASDTSGLYAIYGRKNPYSARAARLGAMAGMDMGGRLGQLPGIAATLLAGKAEKEAEGFEKTRENDIKSFMARKEAYDKIKNDREASRQMFDESTKIMGIAGDKFNQILQETNGDFDKASKDTDAWLSEVANAQGVPLPMVKGYARFKNSKVSMAVSKDGKEWLPIQLDEKTGVALAWDKAKESWGKIPEGYALLSDFAKVQQANRPRGGAGSSPEGMLEYYDANDNLVAKTKNQAEAIAAGAVSAGRWVKTIDENGGEAWKMEKVPLSRAPKKDVGVLNKPGAPAAQPAAPAKAQAVSTQYERPNPVPGSPGSGQAPAPAAQPQMNAEAQQAAAWVAANPNAPASQIAAIKAKYRLP